MKKTLAILLALAMVFSTLTVAFAEGTIGADAQACATLGMLEGNTSAGVTADYLVTNPTRIQAALLFLRLKGLEDKALEFTGTDNFADANQVKWDGYKAVMAYLKANPQLGFQGIGNDKFDPNGLMNASQYYKVVLTALGYKQTTTDVIGDYLWENVLTFAADKGLSKVAAVTNFTVNDLAIATIEGLKATVNGSEKTLVASLIESGAIKEADAIAANVYTAPVLAVVDSVSAITNNIVYVTLENAVAKVNAADWKVIDKNNAAVEIKSAILIQNGEVVKITTANMTVADKYTLTFNGNSYLFTARPADTTAPKLDGAVSHDGIKVDLTFNEDVDVDAASNIANYTIEGLSILSAEVDGKVVTLHTADQTSGKIYKVVVANVTDKAGNVINADYDEKQFGGTPIDKTAPKLTGAVSTEGIYVTLTFDDYLDKATAEDVTNYTIEGLNILKAEIVLDSDDNPTMQVKLTTDAQTSGKIYKVVVGQGLLDDARNAINKDYDEKQFGGTPVDKTAPKLTGAVSSDGIYVTLNFDDNMDETSVENVANYTIEGLTITAAEYKDSTKTVKLTTSAQTSGKIYKVVVANVFDSSMNAVNTDYDEKQFGGTPTDTTAPRLVSAVATAKDKVTVTFNDNMDEATAEEATNYYIDGLGYALDATLQADTTKVVLTTADQSSGVIYKLVVSNVKDTSNNAINTDYDEFSFGGLGNAYDNVAPQVETAVAVDNATIDVFFNEKMDSTSIAASDFTVDNAIGNPTAVKVMDTDKKQVRIQFASDVLSTGTVYTVTVATVNDANGNAIDTDHDTATFAANGIANEKPYVESAYAVDAQTVAIVMSEKVTYVDGTNTAVPTLGATEFSLVSGPATLPTVTKAILQSDKKTIYVYLNAALQAGSIYEIAINDAAVGANNFKDELKVASLTTTADDLKAQFAANSVTAANPTITTVVPVDENTLQIFFDKPVKESGTISTADFTFTGATHLADAAFYELAEDGMSATVYFTTNFGTAGTIHELVVAGTAYVDELGNALDTTDNANEIQFAAVDTTNDAPAISAVIPVDGNTIKVYFTEDVDTTGVLDGADADSTNYAELAALFNVSGVTFATATPDADDASLLVFELAPNTTLESAKLYEMTLAAGASAITDKAGVGAVDTDSTKKFSALAAPAFASVGAYNATAQTITVTFSMEVSGVDVTDFAVSTGTIDTATLAADNKTVTLHYSLVPTAGANTISLANTSNIVVKNTTAPVDLNTTIGFTK